MKHEKQGRLLGPAPVSMPERGQWAEVWAIVYAAVLLDKDRQRLGRGQGVPSLHEEAAGAAALAHQEFLKYVKGEA